MADTMDNIVEGFGVRVSFIGHDLHGIIRDLTGDFIFRLEIVVFMEREDGEIFEASGRGAVFRCDSDGSNSKFTHMA